jgi:hypothetical protein
MQGKGINGEVAKFRLSVQLRSMPAVRKLAMRYGPAKRHAGEVQSFELVDGFKPDSAHIR